MPLTLSERTLAIAPSVTLAVDTQAKKLRAEGMDVIPFSVGEPDFCTPEYINDAGKFAIDAGITRYTAVAGTMDLRQKICDKLFRDNGLEYNPSEIIVSNGAKQIIYTALCAIINPGDEVLIPQPSYVSYEPCCLLAGGKPVIIELKAENEFRLTKQELLDAITDKTKLLVLPFPNNPTGAIMEKEDLEAIAEVIIEKDIFVLSDEIYSELSYKGDHVSITTIPGMKERTILINGFSKAYAMTGWRLGYACGPKEIIEQMLKIHQFAIMCAPTTSQYAAVEAMRNGDEDVAKMREAYNQRRRYLMHAFKEMGLECFEPFGAFYIFPCIKSTGLTSEQFAKRLLESQQVAVVPGTAFGESGEGYVRCSYASSVKNINEAMDRIKRFLESINA